MPLDLVTERSEFGSDTSVVMKVKSVTVVRAPQSQVESLTVAGVGESHGQVRQIVSEALRAKNPTTLMQPMSGVREEQGTRQRFCAGKTRLMFYSV